MSLRIPAIDVHKCLILTACAKLKSDSPGALDHLKKFEKQPMFSYSIREGDTDYTLRLGLDGKREEQHYRIDLATSEFLMRKKLAKPEFRKPEEIHELLQPLFGADFEVSLTSTFLLEPELSPEIVKMLSHINTPIVPGHISMRLTGGTVTVTNSTMYEYSWAIEDDEKVAVCLRHNLLLRMSDSYLEECWSEAWQGFKIALGVGVTNE